MWAIQQMLVSYKSNTSTTYATFDPAFKDTQITLSNWNLTALDTASWFSGVRSTIWKSSGKWYWEIKVDVWEANQNIWIANSTWTTSTNPTSTAGAYVYFASWYFFNNATLQTVSSYTTWDTIWVALDLSWNTLTFFKNNTQQWTPISIASWTWYWIWEAYYNLSKWTANFWATTMTYSAPSGYNQWLYN